MRNFIKRWKQEIFSHVSVHKQTSELIAIVGYYDCEGNPTDKKTQTIKGGLK